MMQATEYRSSRDISSDDVLPLYKANAWSATEKLEILWISPV
jgi:hypothetical protein